MILALKTDNPEAELHLFDPNGNEVDTEVWQAHRELSDTLLIKLEKILERNKKTKQDISGLIVFTGPGSFTGLRIGITTCNTLAYSLNVPLVGTNDYSWLSRGIEELNSTKVSQIIIPYYGSEANITKPRK